MFGFILVVIALQVLVGYDYQTLSILFVWQHKTAPSTYPQAMCLRPLTSQPPSARPPLFFFSYSSCSGWREGAWKMDKHGVFKRQQQKHWVEGYDNSSLLVTVLMQPSLWFPLFAMRVHCWLMFNFSSSWFFSAGVMDCFPGCTDARGSDWPSEQLNFEVPVVPGLKFVEVPLDWCSAIHLPTVLSTNLVRVHLNYCPDSIWRYLIISVCC